MMSPNDPVDRLLEGVEGMRAEAQMLRHEIRVIDDKRKQDRKFLALIVVFMIFLGATAALNRANLVILKDCTTPGGECQKRGAETTGLLLKVIDARDGLRQLKSDQRMLTLQGNPVGAAALDLEVVKAENNLTLAQKELQVAQERSVGDNDPTEEILATFFAILVVVGVGWYLYNRQAQSNDRQNQMDRIDSRGESTGRSSRRMEDAAGVVKDNLAGRTRRADETEGPYGAAADEASKSG